MNKLRDSVVCTAQAGCYSWATLSSNDSKTLYKCEGPDTQMALTNRLLLLQMYVPNMLGTYGSAFSDIALPQKQANETKEIIYYLYVRLEK